MLPGAALLSSWLRWRGSASCTQSVGWARSQRAESSSWMGYPIRSTSTVWGWGNYRGGAASRATDPLNVGVRLVIPEGKVIANDHQRALVEDDKSSVGQLRPVHVVARPGSGAGDYPAPRGSHSPLDLRADVAVRPVTAAPLPRVATVARAQAVVLSPVSWRAASAAALLLAPRSG